jgi:hypothetical protein
MCRRYASLGKHILGESSYWHSGQNAQAGKFNRKAAKMILTVVNESSSRGSVLI